MNFNEFVHLYINENNIGLRFAPNVVDDIISAYSQPHRYYHNQDHIMYMYAMLLQKQFTYPTESIEIITLMILFHDFHYVVGDSDNEQKSADYFKSVVTGTSDKSYETIDLIYQGILATKNHQKHENTLINELLLLDLYAINDEKNSDIIFESEYLLWKEFSFKYDHNEYKVGRTAFLNKMKNSHNQANINKRLAWLSAFQPKVAVYPGSFNPFHIGHYNILKKCERLFDKVIILRLKNPEKDNDKVISDQIEIAHMVVEYSGMLHDFMSRHHKYENETVIRGLRNCTDLQYELNQKKWIDELSKHKIEYMFLVCDDEVSHVSSSGIRTLNAFHKTTSNYTMLR